MMAPPPGMQRPMGGPGVIPAGVQNHNTGLPQPIPMMHQRPMGGPGVPPGAQTQATGLAQPIPMMHQMPGQMAPAPMVAPAPMMMAGPPRQMMALTQPPVHKVTDLNATHYFMMEQMKMAELCGCEENNTYHIYGGYSEEEARAPLHKARMLDILRGKMPYSHMIMHEDGGGIFGFCVRQCCGLCRPINMRALPGTASPYYKERKGLFGGIDESMYQHTIFEMKRPCMAFPCCQCQTLDVSYPSAVPNTPGKSIGKIQADCPDACGICCPSFTVKRGDGTDLAKIEGPTCFCWLKRFEFCCDLPFYIKHAETDEPVALVNHESLFKSAAFANAVANLVKQSASDADIYMTTIPNTDGVSFEDKALLLASTVLIDLSFFERSGKKDEDE